jgi:hypothetical protein
MAINPNQPAAPDSSQPLDLASYLLSCAATLAVVFLERDAHRKRIAEGGEGAYTLSRQYEQDRQWVRSDDASDTFSFVRVCQALELDPTTTRKAFFSDDPLPVAQRSSWTEEQDRS